MQLRLGRGYSILAALLVVGILSTAALVVSAFDPAKANPVALTATAETPTTPAPRPATDGQTQQCQPGYDYTISRSGQGVPNVQRHDVCPPPGTSAVGPRQTQAPTSGQTQPAANQAPTGQEQSFTRCTDQSTGVGTAGFGTRNDPTRCERTKRANEQENQCQWRPKSDFKCRVRYCLTSTSGNGQPVCRETSSPLNLGGAVNPTSIEQNLRGATAAQLMANTPAAQQTAALADYGINAGDRSAINQAYAAERSTLETERQWNAQRIADIDNRLANCASGSSEFCGGAPLTDQQRSDLQAERQRLQAANRQLQERMSNLAQAPQATLTPPPNPERPPSAPPPNNERPPRAARDTFPPANRGPGSGEGARGIGDMLSSLMQGLGKALGQNQQQQQPQQQPAQPCAADPSAYQRQQQEYQMQLQQYQYQQQMFQYQQQQSQYYGGYPPSAPPPPPSPCSPNAQQNTCPVAPAQPSSGCTGTWQPQRTTLSNGIQCTTGWQCAPSNAPTPTAELSCQPKVIDADMSVALSFSCGNATGSSGTGFDTENKTSGSVSAKLKDVPTNATGYNFVLACSNQSKTTRAECKVQIARPSIVLTVNPKTVPSGEISRVGWVTSSMKSCVVSSPQMPGFTQQNANNKSINGVATTSPITRMTEIVLKCETIGGNTKTATTTIQVGAGTSTAMSVSSSIDGKANVKHGDAATVTWHTPNPPAHAAVALWLVDVQSNQATGLIQGKLATSGTFNWTLPAKTIQCPVDTPIVCGADLVPGRSYTIQASLYTPADAHLGGYPPPNPITPSYIDDVFTQAFKIAN